MSKVRIVVSDNQIQDVFDLDAHGVRYVGGDGADCLRGNHEVLWAAAQSGDEDALLDAVMQCAEAGYDRIFGVTATDDLTVSIQWVHVVSTTAVQFDASGESQALTHATQDPVFLRVDRDGLYTVAYLTGEPTEGNQYLESRDLADLLDTLRRRGYAVEVTQ